jgi:quercetin dioxygenase-like cupin family protein
MEPIHIKRSTLTAEPTRHGDDVMKEVLLRSGVLPAVTQVATATIPPNHENELHEHPTMFEIYYVLSGEADYDIAGQTYSVGPGDFVIVPPATQHRQRTKSAPHRIFYWGIATG